MLYKSVMTAIVVAAAVQSFTVGILSKKLSLELCRPGAESARNFSFDGVHTVKLKNADGAVRVNVVSGTHVNVAANIRAYTVDWATQPVSEQYVTGLVVAEQTGDSLQITTEPGERPDAVDLRVDYVIEVPEGTDLNIAGSNGNVWIAKGCDDLVIEGNNCDIEVMGATGAVHAKSANGRIRILDAAKSTEVETVNGSIYATVSGGDLRATTANGNIVTTLGAPSVASCDLTAMNGGITLLLAKDCSAEVAATTGRGTIRSELPVDAPSGTSRRRELRGRIGDGETRLNLNSLNGNISIARSDS